MNETIVDGNLNITSGTLDENSFIEINGTIITGFKVETDDANGELASQINAHTQNTGVVATVDSNFRLVLTAIDGRNIEVKASDANASAITGLSTGVTTSTVNLESEASFTVDGNNLGFLGFNNPQIVGVNSNSSVATIEITSRESANRSIEIIDRALEQISSDRGELGAIQNRLESTVNNLSSITENASASRSRILDADFAAESATMARRTSCNRLEHPSWHRLIRLVWLFWPSAAKSHRRTARGRPRNGRQRRSLRNRNHYFHRQQVLNR